jgi:hypothetical protein
MGMRMDAQALFFEPSSFSLFFFLCGFSYRARCAMDKKKRPQLTCRRFQIAIRN